MLQSVNGRRQSAVAFVIFTDEKNVKHTILGRHKLGSGGLGRQGFPGGYVDATDKSYQEAALRELKEETGLVINIEQPTSLPVKAIYRDIHAVTIDLGQLNQAQISDLSSKLSAQDDLGAVGIYNANEFNKMPTRTCLGGNKELFNQYTPLGYTREQSPCRWSNTNPQNPERKNSLKSHTKSSQGNAFARKNPGKMGTFQSTHTTHKDPKTQAQHIWDTQVEPVLKNGGNIGLIYSANNDQAKDIYRSYESYQLPKIGGGGQAPVFLELAKMIKNNKVEDQVRILPISTSNHGGNNADTNNTVSREVLDRDLDNIAKHGQEGWTIKGFSYHNGYSIGGGESKAFYNKDNASINYEGRDISQGDYVQKRLKVIENTPETYIFQQPQRTPIAQQKSKSVSLSQDENPVSKDFSENNSKKLSPDHLVVKNFIKAVEEKKIEGKFEDGKLCFDKADQVDPFMKEQAETTNFAMVNQHGKMYVSNGKGFYASGSKEEVTKAYSEYKNKQAKEAGKEPDLQPLSVKSNSTALWKDLLNTCRDKTAEPERDNTSTSTSGLGM